MQHRAGAEDELRLAVPGARREQVERVGCWLFVDGMPCIGAADSNEHVVLSSHVRHDVAFAFAAELAAHDHVDRPRDAAAIQPEAACETDEDVVRRASTRVDDDVGDAPEPVHARLGRVCAHVVVRRQRFYITGSAGVSGGENFGWSRQVYVQDTEPEGFPDSFCLRSNSHRVDDHRRIVGEVGARALESLGHPLSARLPIEPLARGLKRAPLLLDADHALDELAGLDLRKAVPRHESVTERRLARGDRA